MRRFRSFVLISAIIPAIFFVACKPANRANPSAIAVFVPGVLEGSPTYEMMDSGTREAAKTRNVEVKTIEAGFDQASWENQMMVLASEGRYGLIVTSNPAMTEISRNVVKAFPAQEVLVLDGSGVDNDTVATLSYNHREQAFLVGYFAALVSSSTELKGANDSRKIGMIVGQEYPQMNKEIRPGFEIGIQSVLPDAELEFRVLGNWYDAEKARELAADLYSNDVDVILTIAGGANQGVIAAAIDAGAYVLWFDSEGSEYAPGTVLASAVIEQERAARELVSEWMEDNLEMGENRRVGIVEGYVNFPDQGRLYNKHVPESIRNQMKIMIDRMRSGALSIRSLDE